MMNDFQSWFKARTGHEPHQWQIDLCHASDCESRLIRIPTGMGKTFGVFLVWLYRRQILGDDRWPRRLIWMLPMRVLVEQTYAVARSLLDGAGLLWDGSSDHEQRVGLHLLMGGSDADEWHLHPEHAAVLIGTQDMLLSRALNRGYAASRARWPMEFGLLHTDCLWVMDEVQLMDVGLATSGQLQAFRDAAQSAGKMLRPCATWWMSATLQRDWLAKSPETLALAPGLPETRIEQAGRVGPLWDADRVQKPCTMTALADGKAFAKLVAAEHLASGRGANGPTLVVVNTVERAIEIHDALVKDKSLAGSDARTEMKLVHSRFRPHERKNWLAQFLHRDACAAGTDRIVVATQVIEAGVDISAGLLITELAPWPSLVQRFGRCARWGGTARVLVVDLGLTGDKALPYTDDDLAAARGALGHVQDVAPLHLEAFEEQNPTLLPGLYPYNPQHLLLPHELSELFDTTPDLTGADIDISRFIRSGKERDLSVFWVDIGGREHPDASVQPMREALCAVQFLKARKWLCGNEKATNLEAGKRAWIWDWLNGTWRPARGTDLYPGQTVLVAADAGGYDPIRGWTPGSKSPVATVPATTATTLLETADSRQDSEALSSYAWQTIAVHSREVGRAARKLADALSPRHAALFVLVGRWHDVGKAHAAFQGSIAQSAERSTAHLLAKAPEHVWKKGDKLYPGAPGEPRRAGFRHELASVLALFAVLQRHAPTHPALLGEWGLVLGQAGFAVTSPISASAVPPTVLEQEILALDADTFNLLAYLICAHHGKVRLAWHACPDDQAAQDAVLRIRGVRDDDVLPQVTLYDATGQPCDLPASRLDLAPSAAGLSPRTGPSWTERTLGLMDAHGPFALAWLEALIRAADVRASKRLDIIDEFLYPEVTP